MLIAGLALWSAATLALPLCGSLLAGGGGAPFWATPLAGLVAARVAFGLASSVALPATAASVALLVPSGRRASALSLIYAAFNVGSLVGLATTPHVIAAAGWPAAFRLWGAVGLAWAAAAWAALPAAARRRPPPAHAPVPPPPPPAKPWFARPPAGAGGGGVAAAAGSAAPAQPRAARLPRLAPGGGLPHLLALIWVHSVIGFGYFVLLAWTPTFFATAHAKAFGTLSAVGLVSALPWACSAAAGLVCGPAADAVAAALARRGAAGAAGGARGGAAAAGRGVRSPLFGLRCAAHAVATLLPALSLALLPVAPGPGAAVALLCCATGAQALNYAGFHAHVADVAGPAAGRVLALTNSGGIAAGIAGNLLAGGLLRATGSFAAVFGAAAALYLSSALVWALFVRGEPLFE